MRLLALGLSVAGLLLTAAPASATFPPFRGYGYRPYPYRGGYLPSPYPFVPTPYIRPVYPPYLPPVRPVVPVAPVYPVGPVYPPYIPPVDPVYVPPVTPVGPLYRPATVTRTVPPVYRTPTVLPAGLGFTTRRW